MVRKHKKRSAAGIRRLAGIFMALFVLCAALLDTHLNGLWTINAEAEETPKIAHYVNRKDEAKNGNVHIDLETGAETFAFDLQAYIPPEAEKLVITETLNPVFCFVNAESVYRWQFQSGMEYGKNPPLSNTEVFLTACAPVVRVDRTTDTTRETLIVELDLSVLSAEEKAQVRGKWLRFGFDVRIKDYYALDESMAEFVFSNYSNTAPITSNEPVSDAPEGAHSGLTAQASYIVETAAGSSEAVYSNNVTIARMQDQQENAAQEATNNTANASEEKKSLAESVVREETVDATVADTGTETVPKTRSTTLQSAKTTARTTEETSEEEDAGTVTLSGLISFADVPDNKLPQSLTITVLADGKEQTSFELDGTTVAKVTGGEIGPGCTVDPVAVGNAWGFTITKLKEKAEDGTPINYTIKETVRPEGYVVSYVGGADYADAQNSYRIINTYSGQQAQEDEQTAATTTNKTEEEEEESKKQTTLKAGTVELLVNGENRDTSLKQRDDKFTYTINAVVPAGAKTFTITDTLDPVLKVYSKPEEITVTVNGVTVPAEGNIGGSVQQTVVLDGQSLTVRLPDAEQHEGETVSVRFDAIVRSDMDLSTFAANGGIIPNSAKAEATDGASQSVSGLSTTRFVKLPEEAGVKKTVNDSENYVMEAAGDELSYTITARIPLDAVTYTLVDTVSQVIEVKSATAKIGGSDVSSSAITTRGQEVSLKIDDAYNYAGETITMNVKAKIVDGADLSLFNNYKVPNTATIFINGRLYETSEPATVDGSVLGVRRRRGNIRGGKTGDKRLYVDIGVGAAAFISLIVLLRKRVEF